MYILILATSPFHINNPLKTAMKVLDWALKFDNKVQPIPHPFGGKCVGIFYPEAAFSFMLKLLVQITCLIGFYMSSYIYILHLVAHYMKNLNPLPPPHTHTPKSVNGRSLIAKIIYCYYDTQFVFVKIFIRWCSYFITILCVLSVFDR